MGFAGALPGGSTSTGPGRRRARLPERAWLSETLGFWHPAVGTLCQWSRTPSCPIQTGQSSQEGSKAGSHDPWDGGSPRVSRAGSPRCSSSSTREFVRDAHSWPPAQTRWVRIWGRAQQSGFTRPPDDSEPRSDWGSQCPEYCPFRPSFPVHCCNAAEILNSFETLP